MRNETFEQLQSTNFEALTKSFDLKQQIADNTLIKLNGGIG
jgi:hypothetical protein